MQASSSTSCDLLMVGQQLGSYALGTQILELIGVICEQLAIIQPQLLQIIPSDSPVLGSEVHAIPNHFIALNDPAYKGS